MLKTLRRLAFQGTRLFPLSIVARLNPATLFPYHHTVSDVDLPHVKHLYRYRSKAEFSSELDLLLKRYQPLSIDDLVDSLANRKPLPKRKFLLTFDDGFRQIFDTVAPMLLAKGIPAVFLLNPNFLDNKLLFFRCKVSLIIEKSLKEPKSQALNECKKRLGIPTAASHDAYVQRLRKVRHDEVELLDSIGLLFDINFEDFLRNEQPFMTSDQVESLVAQGFTVGGHSLNHPFYDLLNLGEQVHQTIESCKTIQERFGGKYRLFSFPFGDRTVPTSFFESMEDQQKKVDVYFGTQNQLNESCRRIVHRFSAESPTISFSTSLKGVLLWNLIRSLTRRGGFER